MEYGCGLTWEEAKRDSALSLFLLAEEVAGVVRVNRSPGSRLGCDSAHHIGIMKFG